VEVKASGKWAGIRAAQSDAGEGIAFEGDLFGGRRTAINDCRCGCFIRRYCVLVQNKANESENSTSICHCHPMSIEASSSKCHPDISNVLLRRKKHWNVRGVIVT
jgi:hypothetical protein